MIYYDMIIVGAGPAGLALAHCYSNTGKKILVIDREQNIGGCHRVKRVSSGLFTEHGPRVYLSNYVNFFYLLSEIGLNKDDLFTKYKYDVNYLFFKFSFHELWVFIGAYMQFLFNHDYGDNISLVKFCQDNGYSKESIDILDRLCRYMDGADIKKYSVGKILKTMDAISGIMQPKGPLDNLLFDKWQKYLENKGVTFALGKEVSYIHHNPDRNKIDYIEMHNDDTLYYCNKLVLAIPPASITKILSSMDNNYVKNSFGDLHQFERFAEDTEYIEYISITYHFRGDVHIPEVHGMTFDTDWGIIVVNLSEYMKDIEKGYDKVISTAVTICDKKSKYINKTANECDKSELYAEVYRQLKESIYPTLPDGYVAVINPNNYYDKQEKKWKTTDEAYFNTIGTSYIPFQSHVIPNIYNVGTHNGHSYLAYTTLESAVSNGIALACKLCPQLRYQYHLRKSWKISDIIYVISTIILVIICIYITRNFIPIKSVTLR